MHDHDVWVFQRSGLGRFAIKTLEHFRIAGQTLRHRLNSDLAVQLAVGGSIHHAHPAAADEFDHLVFTYALDVWSGQGYSVLTAQISNSSGGRGIHHLNELHSDSNSRR